LHRNTLLRVENSQNYTIKTLLKLADYYGIQPSEIMSIID
jgi:transcriptional regulator with XRE-family HTH domain